MLNNCSHEAKLIVPATYRLDDGRVNSTTLVELLTQGKVSQVETLLSRYYAVDLGQIPLKITGSSLSFVIEDAVQLPPPGVYQTVEPFDGSTLEVIAHLTPDSLNLAEVQRWEFNHLRLFRICKEFIDDVDERDEESNCWKNWGNAQNTGSADVQIALLTARIRDLQDHFKEFPGTTLAQSC